MKHNILLIVVALNLAVLLAVTFYAPHLMIQPGEVMAAHKEIATDCFACHSPFTGSSSDKCKQCHKPNEIGLQTTQGIAISAEQKRLAFHQQLKVEDCVACHSDHRGVQAFKPIGRFSHDLLTTQVATLCADCHSKPGDALHQKITGNCSQCHTIAGWLPATFEHDRYFRFDRYHDAACDKCHVQNDYSTYTCYGCHEHSRSEIREEHLEEGIRDYEQCVECHRSGDEEEAERAWRLKRGSGNDDEGSSRRPYRREHDD